MKEIIVILICMAYTLGILNGYRRIPIWLNATLIGLITYIACRVIG